MRYCRRIFLCFFLLSNLAIIVDHSDAFQYSDVRWDQSGEIQIVPRRARSISPFAETRIVTNPDVQQEVELTPSQIDDVNRLIQEQNSELRSLYREAEGREEQLQRLQLLQRDSDRKILELLVPQQQERLREVTNRIEMRRVGLVEYCKNKNVPLSVGLLETQRLQEEMQAILEAVSNPS